MSVYLLETNELIYWFGRGDTYNEARGLRYLAGMKELYGTVEMTDGVFAEATRFIGMEPPVGALNFGKMDLAVSKSHVLNVNTP